ncbi:MAG: thioesterase [Desulfovibrionaceae bacterium]|nr:thioesterase [Desulfovibrionaceae bacterium]
MDTRVRHRETSADGKARLAAVADWLQEAAALNAKAMGFGEDQVFARGITWVLTRMVLQINRLPRTEESIRVRTWPGRLDRFGHRGYEILNADDATLLLSAAAEWTILDLKTRHIAPMPEDMIQEYPEKTFDIIPFSGKILPKAQNCPHRAQLLVRKDDLDVNGHVNNALYFSWILEPMPKTDKQLAMVDIRFRSETFPGDHLESSCTAYLPTADDTNLLETRHTIMRTDENGNQTETCRARLFWKEATHF